MTKSSQETLKQDLNLSTQANNVVLVIHGSAGLITLTAEKEKACCEVLEKSLREGFKKLKETDNSIKAIMAAIEFLEDSPLFNAARGAVFTNEGKIELDASIMDGKTHKAGACASITNVKNPIKLAYAVMQYSHHVLLVGDGAENFAQTVKDKAGLEIVDNKYFHTEARWQQLQDYLLAQKNHAANTVTGASGVTEFGTVGAVAVDRNGNLAAGTSTGGLLGKLHGRIGDSPILGAGTYADNATCAISTTGHGEYFMRFVTAYDISAQMKYANRSLSKAVVNAFETLQSDGGKGGLIALDAHGNCTMAFNTKGMYRGYITEDGNCHVAIFPSGDCQ
jgi:beta-aspartyl-peptidase (threonine type)